MCSKTCDIRQSMMELRTIFIVLFSLVNIYSGHGLRCNPKSAPRKRPNIVFILSDDQGWNDVGWNNPEVLTPRMDYLAHNGVILDQSYMQPICSPSRGAILSGVYPFHSGLQWFIVLPRDTKFLPLGFKILPQHLKDLGYSTHLSGKWHIGYCKKEVLPTSRGFDTFFGFYGGAIDYFTRRFGGVYDFWKGTDVFNPPSLNGTYVTDLLTDHAVNIIKRNDPNDPMFLFLSYSSPHFPLQAQPEFLDKFSHVSDKSRRTYLAMVNSLDHSVGKVVDALTDTGQMDDTVLIFLSDLTKLTTIDYSENCGYENETRGSSGHYKKKSIPRCPVQNGGTTRYGASNFPLRGEKKSLWEGGTRTPGFVYSPRHLPRRGCTFKGLIHAVDWLPTLLEVAGLSHSKRKQLCKDIDGVSQWRNLRQCSGSARHEFVYNIDGDIAKNAAIRYGPFKLIVGEPVMYGRIIPGLVLPPPPVNPNSTDIHLFNLIDDPYETNNIAEQRPDLVAKLIERIDFYRKSGVPALNPPRLSPEITVVNGTLSTNYC